MKKRTEKHARGEEPKLAGIERYNSKIGRAHV